LYMFQGRHSNNLMLPSRVPRNVALQFGVTTSSFETPSFKGGMPHWLDVNLLPTQLTVNRINQQYRYKVWGPHSCGYIFWDITYYISSQPTFRRNIQALLPTWFHAGSCSVYSSTLKVEEICPSETSADFQRTTRRYIPEDRTLHCRYTSHRVAIILQLYYWQSSSTPEKMLLRKLIYFMSLRHTSFVSRKCLK
jgi:hypothetical protein